MDILLTCDPYFAVPPQTYGGVERIAGGLLAELQGRGHRLGLVAHADSQAAVGYFKAFPCAWPKSARAAMRNMVTVLQAVREFRPEVVQSFSRLLYLASLLPTRLPKVQSYQRFPGGRHIGFAAAMAGPSLVYTGCSEFIAAMGRPHGGRWRAIYNFVDTNFYRFSPAVPPDAPLVFLSRIEHLKGAHLAITIAKKTGRRLVLAGNHAEAGPDGEYWQAMIRPELGNNGIDYVGPVDDNAKNALLGTAAAMIVPIQWEEPFGIVFAEALACGTPVIACPRGAAPEIVRDRLEGFLISDIEDACRAVEAIGTIERRRCRIRAEEAFSAAAVVPQYEALYETMMQDSSRPQAAFSERAS